MIGRVEKTALMLCVAFVFWGGTHFANAESTSSLKLHEVLTARVGKGTTDIGDQFGGGEKFISSSPFQGFVVTSNDEILISDTVNGRIQRFSQDGKHLGSYSLGITKNKDPFFLPGQICADERQNIYVHEKKLERIVAFSHLGTISGTYSPGHKVFESLYRQVPIISMKCEKDRIILAFGIDRIRGGVQPVYVDQYDLFFKLIGRKIFENEAAYYKAKEEEQPIAGFLTNFEDSNGNKYSYPIEKDSSGKFMPLVKHSREGLLLYRIDARWLSQRTKYKVHDYLDLEGWGAFRGKDLLIVNWYVTLDGTIYGLLANNDYVKVLRIFEDRE
jgi:hypothetical protein